MGGIFANLMLYGWPVLVLVLYARLPRVEATMWSIVGAYLLLPQMQGFKIPGVPVFDRDTAALFAAVAACAALDARDRRLGVAPNRRWLPESGLIRLLLFVFVAVSPIMTVLTNGDRVQIGGASLPGLRLYDAGASVNVRIVTIMPYLLARRYLGGAEEQTRALKVYVLAGAAYAFPVLFEARMSPQLHEWIYGFRAFSFAQQIRNDGFRPVVFLNHGLWTAIFMATAFIGALALWRGGGSARRLGMAVSALTGVALAASNSFGALAIAALFAPAARFFSARAQLIFAAALALVVLLYPMMRSTGLVPTSSIVSAVASQISAERSRSLNYRFHNEDLLLGRANERLLFGWGGWQRNRVFDPVTGQDVSTTDGRWILVFGTAGWVGFLSTYGLLVAPVLMLARRQSADVPPAAVGFALLLSANLIDTLLNGTMTPLTWLAAGAVLAQAEAQRRTIAPTRRSSAATAPAARGRIVQGATPRS